MKMIFDNEEQKEKVCGTLAASIYCPSDLGLIDSDDVCDAIGRTCVECWKNAVKGESDETDI